MISEEGRIMARDIVIEEIKKYMVGPAGGVSEQLSDKPWEFYHTGMLWPPDSDISGEEDDQSGESASGEEGNHEGFLNLANCAQQSAMGTTFHLSGESQTIRVEAEWAVYNPEEIDDEDKKGEKRRIWKREALKADAEISLSTGSEDFSRKLYDENGITIRGELRTRENYFVLTLVLVNSQAVKKKERYENIVYQPEIRVTTDGIHGIISPPFPESVNTDEDFWTYELIYRKTRLHAVGHGCSVDWDSDTPVSFVKTSWIPEQEVLKASSDVLKGSKLLSLEFLSNEDNRDKICHELKTLPAEYEKWISEREESIDSIVGEFDRGRDRIHEAADKNLRDCRKQLTRIEEGISVLEKNDDAWTSFCLANRTIAESIRKKSGISDPRWRAFQLAFILLTFPSSIDPGHDDRDELDLIWFPTGGGKTEAYLGLAAMVIFYRSLSGGGSVGTTVITRYTLRLLTIQQFERAATMICAANLVKKNHPAFSSVEDYSIGLFVGGGATPNRVKEASGILVNPEASDKSTTLPIKKCPWCGDDLSASFQEVDEIGKKMITKCPNEECEYSEGLPIRLIDEEIYNSPPTIIIGTVDKFASMAWEPGMRSLFGKNRPDSRPPDLIIQDELHLITNALGTVTALYETAIDYLCRYNNRPVKIIGSTATIRRASEQTRKLFNRSAMQFPPSGTDADDSFFYKADKKNPGRTYLGIHAQGRSPKHTLARLAGNCLQSNMHQPEESKDLFYTLVMYFNSMRELGGALVLLEDDVPRYLNTLPGIGGGAVRTIPQKKELTSQLSSAEIPEVLKQLEFEYGSENTDYEPVDVVLATNMISVGMDVDRLGMMIVNGQPKNTSEYIQASSRVGRRTGYPGIVVTLYNWTRPRDRSHYERFKAFHQAFYKHVESTGVTPFAARARDRALHAVLFSLARQEIQELGNKGSAGRISDEDIYNKISELRKVIVERVEDVDSAELIDTTEELIELQDQWKAFAENVSGDYYWSLTKKDVKYYKLSSSDTGTKSMMKRPDEMENDNRITVPTSMREVEPATAIKLLLKRGIN